MSAAHGFSLIFVAIALLLSNVKFSADIHVEGNGLMPWKPGIPKTYGTVDRRERWLPSPQVRNDIDSLTRRARAGDARAQTDLGIAYAYGRGVRANPAEAARLFHAAAMSGVPEAQFNLAILYESGTGVARNLGQAHAWHRMAARQGYRRSIDRLRSHYP
jgi:TPR repeat protein